MKHSIKAIPIIYAAAFCAAVLSAPSAEANAIPIDGSIAFNVSGVVPNNTVLALATSFYVDSPIVTGGPTINDMAYVGEIPQGSYSSVPLDTIAAFTPFTFTQPGSVDPLWTFTIGSGVSAITYSFDATSIVADWNAGRSEWDIGGSGMAMITGFIPTAGTWTINLSQTDSSFAFDATTGASATVPDGGSNAILLGGAFLGLAVFGRKARR
jgi:hypothetical protein